MKSITKNIVLSAMFLAIGLVLPLFTAQIPQIGQMLLPMHIPVLLCGFVCGWQSGAVVGFVLPLLRSAIFGMPVFFPTATGMAFELMTYGLVAGLLYSLSKWKCLLALYRSMAAQVSRPLHTITATTTQVATFPARAGKPSMSRDIWG